MGQDGSSVDFFIIITKDGKRNKYTRAFEKLFKFQLARDRENMLKRLPSELVDAFEKLERSLCE